MEERTITAIAHKDGLIRYHLQVNDALHKALSTWNNEIFKYYLRGEILELVIESKYASEIEHLIIQRQLTLIERHEGIAFITLVGLGINLDFGFLAETMQLCNSYNIMSISHSDKTLELMLPSSELTACLQALHHAFIGERA